MLIWFCFFILVYFLIYRYGCAISKKQKISYYFLFLLVIVYFSAFRDGMGMDYTAYQSYCEHYLSRFDSFLFGQEPLAALLEFFCYSTKFSAVVFFLVTSILICALCTFVYIKYKNPVIALFVFVTYTNLYLMSFNLVRQFVASAFILIGSYYFIMQKRKPYFFLFVLAAFLFHKSAVLFVLIYFLPKTDINRVFWICIILASWMFNIQPLFNIPIIYDLLVMGDYQSYLSYDVESYSRFSIVNLYMHAIIILFIWNNKKISDANNKEHFFFALKMSAISIICSNISAGDLPFAYRYAIFCSVYIPILFSYLPMIIERRLISFAVYIPLCVLIWTVLYNKQNDRIYCPQQILPIESILDENYHPYQNPKEVPL